MKVIYWIMAFFIGIACFNATSAPPKFVFRLDTRSPEQIFTNGFVSWGNNHNVFAHTSGNSCVENEQNMRDSGFISTSANAAWATAMANVRAMQFPGENYYLYRIRANENFYNAEISLQQYARINPAAVITGINYLPSIAANEYITPDRIPVENIESVSTYFSRSGEAPAVVSEPNPAYVSRNTHASESPYMGDSDSTNRRFTWVRHIPFIGACMSSHDEMKYKNSNQNPYALERLILHVLLE